MRHVLVLGGGGPVGIAWELGVLAGLADEGLDLGTGAERIVGTSAGAVVGAQLAAGRGAAELYAAHDALAQGLWADEDVRAVAGSDLAPLMAFFARRPPTGPAPPAMMREMGSFALAASTMPEEAFLGGIGRLILAPHAPWPERFSCTAVQADTGAFQLWDAAGGVDLVRAVASSCAVPGLYPPVTLAGRRYVDGGLRSALNSDLAGDAPHVVALAVTVEPFAGIMAETARREVGTLPAAETGGVGLVVPDAACLAAFGNNLLDGTRHRAVAAAGRAQGRAMASTVRGAWEG